MERNVIHLERGFTSSEEQYNHAIAFWRSRILNALNVVEDKSDYSDWLENRDLNGKLVLDGNPIFSLIRNDKSKALRIMQNEPRSSKAYMSAWLESFEENDTPIPTLAIGLELSNVTLNKSLMLIQQWFLDEDRNKIQFLINKVNQEFEKNYVKSDAELAFELHEEISQRLIVLKTIKTVRGAKEIQLETITGFKQVYDLKSYLEHNYIRTGHSPRKTILDIYSAVSAMSTIISLNGTFRFGHGYQRGTYIHRYFSSFQSYHSSITTFYTILEQYATTLERLNNTLVEELTKEP